MEYRSRLKTKVKNAVYKNTFTSIVVIAIIFLVLIFFGLQLLVKFSLLIGRIKGVGDIEQTTSSQSDFVLVPILNPLFEATNTATIEVSGLATSTGQTIELFLNNDLESTTIVDSKSQFIFSSVRLESGENKIKVRAKINDKESQFSNETVIVYDITPPALEIKEPADGQTIKKSAQVKIIGKTEADAQILINDFLSIVDNNGGFSYTLPLKEGENNIKVVALDRAGNQTTNQLKIIFEP